MIQLSKTALVQSVLGNMTQSELRATAAALDVPRGKNKSSTASNLSTALLSGKAHFTAMVIIRTAPDSTGTRNLVFQKKIRTHKADKTIFLTPPIKAV